ncbi:topoisomerase DNA-binding C4 zinc finger domain-containing protein [Pseudomonas sp. KFB-139]|uniref:Topoisomerase DNA-binding C4 zinc finger domain-containing protein n=1 Tax=Pseudomonas serbiensis TaxID=3064350 RepID=A0ABT9CWU6_9PSED|nr:MULTISPECIES: topoisomerase DNA-binding C4 zinc finger domain-containing protein [Pseudomonas]MDO7929979.1 topoisomerase DNA-binding C4 zinc finger domain-containing protein [Pseudomonas sp. KFB-138]
MSRKPSSSLETLVYRVSKLPKRLSAALISLLARRKRQPVEESPTTPEPHAPQPVEPDEKTPSAPVIAVRKAVKKTAPPKPVIEPAAPNCPHCKKTMIMKVARTGRNAGGHFWGCTDYPKCRGMRGMFRTV